MMIYISLCSGLQSQCEAHGSLRMVAKQFSVNAKDLCDISFVSTPGVPKAGVSNERFSANVKL